ncbi:hypothetical protein [Goodfellowiella coeruleoviolacea]|uniref:hypothetical protein n=1 Tax=Goodfellowiella coeruleoviolacea TaxID=334858 RepID=UPI0020A3BEEA|nr:hypothetical protein [Goodfellowiella coeruleoviolacea]
MLVVNQVRRSNTAGTWGMAAVMVVVSSAIPFWVNPPDLSELLVTMFFSLFFVAGYRRFQLRPKITWEHSGLDVVGDGKTRRVEWSDVRDIHIFGNYVVIKLVQGKVESPGEQLDGRVSGMRVAPGVRIFRWLAWC